MEITIWVRQICRYPLYVIIISTTFTVSYLWGDDKMTLTLCPKEGEEVGMTQ